MIDRNTEIRHPHDEVVTRKDGVTERVTRDPRTSVSVQEEGATLTLFFDPDRAWTGDAALFEVRLTPTAGGEFQPWRLMPTLMLHLQYARSTLAREHGDAHAALRALRRLSSTRRGHSDDFLRIVAQLHGQLIEEDEPHPIKALAKAQDVDVSTASRWVTAARHRGLLDEVA
jgi:hypothetical protein